MLNFTRRDRAPEPKDADKAALRPAIYDPPGVRTGIPTAPAPRAAALASAVQSPGTSALDGSSRDGVALPMGSPTDAVAGATPWTESPGSRLAVGVNIRLKGMEVSNCDTLVIEGSVEATVHSKALEIAGTGTLTGIAHIDVAAIHGEFSGELTARTRLVIHGTGRVTGTIRYGKLVVEEGGELRGDVNRLDESTVAAPPLPMGLGEPQRVLGAKHDLGSH